MQIRAPNDYYTIAHAYNHSKQTATAFAPASVGNLGVGFDILGMSLAGPGDHAIVRRIQSREVRIAAIRGNAVELPMEAERNTAGAALIALRDCLDLPFGFEIELDKGIAFGSGMGGSAASAVAALVAANALLDSPLSPASLYPLALTGEAVASGGRHGDNVGPMLLGGVVLATAEQLVRVPAPDAWHCVLVHPEATLETRRAREALKGHLRSGRIYFAKRKSCTDTMRIAQRQCRSGSRRSA